MPRNRSSSALTAEIQKLQADLRIARARELKMVRAAQDRGTYLLGQLVLRELTHARLLHYRDRMSNARDRQAIDSLADLIQSHPSPPGQPPATGELLLDEQ